LLARLGTAVLVMHWPFRKHDLDILIDPATITAAPADTPITTPAAFIASDEGHRDFSGEARATSEPLQHVYTEAGTWVPVERAWEDMAGELACALEAVLDSARCEDGGLHVDDWKIDRAIEVLYARLALRGEGTT
jgi:hypothetical protein